MLKLVNAGRFIVGCATRRADGCARDHTDEHERRHVVARLLEKPHQAYGREEDVTNVM